VALAPPVEPSAEEEESPAAQDEAPVAAAPDQVELRIVANPRNAKVLLDGAPLPNPFVGKVLRDNREHQLRISSKGFTGLSSPVSFEKDAALVFTLQKLGEPPHKPPVATRPRPKSASVATVSEPAADPHLNAEASPAPAPTPAATAPTRGRRELDSDNPYGSAPLPAPSPKGKRRIDRDNPFQTGEKE
jgi:hypothetical protein